MVEPIFDIEKSVEVENAEVVDAIVNRVCELPKPEVDVAMTESRAYGEVVPRPNLPVVVFQTNWLVPALPN